MKKTLLALALGSLCAISFSASCNDKPLLQDGSKSLYQRVLTTPSCKLSQTADGKNGSAVDAFSRFYVYGREGGYVKVGPDTTGKIAGYLLEECTVPWKIQTALLFNNPASRDRAIIFEKYDTLTEIMNLDDPKAIIDPIKEKVYKGQSAKGVIATEPETYVNFAKQFYLLPILDSSESMFADGSPALELKIASVTADGSAASQTLASAGGKGTGSAAGSAITAFKAGIVFVVDASISMQPYIDRTKMAINTIVSKLKDRGLEDYVQFGLVSFRSNTKAVPALEYESKTFLKPGEALTVDEFNEKLKDLKQASVSSKLFDEDAYSGISRALNEVNWDEFGGRYIVLITDAGAIEGSNDLSTTHLDAAQIASEAEKKKTAIFTLHLLTSAGKKNHAKAKAQYQTLSYNNAIQDTLYESINAGSVDEFGKKIDHFAEVISNQVRLASDGKVGAGSAAIADSSELDKKLTKLGYAMQLYYLGDKLGTKAPDFIQGWMADRDLVDHSKAVVEPVVLLTRKELADLYDLVSQVQMAVDERSLGSADSFASLRELALKMGSDPDKVKDKSLNLTQMGLMDEYLAALPYKSRIAEIDEDTWNALSPQEQDSIYRDLSSKLEHYKIYDGDHARWVSLSEGASEREKVYPVPLRDLP